MVHEVVQGKRTRMSYSRIDEVLTMPDLVEVQKKSYKRFLETDMQEVLADFSPITDFSGNLKLEFIDYYLENNPKYSVEECKERDTNYAAPLKVKVRLTIKNQGAVVDIKEQEVFMGDFPLMTDTGTFIINGAERVVVSQLVRSPGVYYTETKDKTGKSLFSAQAIPNRGAWLEFEIDSNEVFWVKVDRTRKLPVTVLLRALGVGTDEEIIAAVGDDARIRATIERDSAKNVEQGQEELYKRLRPGETATAVSVNTLLNAMFFDDKRYDLAKVGRYKFNSKLALSLRIVGKLAAEDIVNPETGELLAEKGQEITRELAKAIEDSGINSLEVISIRKDDQNENIEEIVKVVGNGFVDAAAHLPFDPAEVGITEKVHYATLKEILDQGFDETTLKAELKNQINKLVPKHIYLDDIIAAVNYALCLNHGIGSTDDIDHLGNRRIRSVGELLQNQMRIGLSRLERVVRERMGIQDMATVTPMSLINIRPVTAAIKEFFGSSQLSHYMDQNNPLAELTHKRRLSALGPGGLNRDRASFDVRDVHHSHYGRMCPIETPEGPNIGLIGSLSTYARINQYGFIESPYRKVDKATGKVTDIIEYLTADEEDRYTVAQANEPLDAEGRFVHEFVACRRKEEIIEEAREMIDYMDVSPKQVVSVATAMIPFLENDDASRALMGANMQRQAVPLLKPQAPIVGTGIEYKAAYDSGVCVINKETGTVIRVDANGIDVRSDEGNVIHYRLTKFIRSNQGTCINQRPVVSLNQRVEAGEVLADGPSTDMGELSLGRNILIGFMSWEGYNYEDAILISEKLVKEDVFTSIHIEEHESEARDTKLGPEEITRDIPNVGEDSLKDLDEDGIIRIGAEVHSGDILVGKVTPKGETELTAEERLLRAIFGEKAREVRDTSLRVPHGEGGVVVDVKIFTRENKDELSPGVNKLVRVYIAQKRKISVGDKMAGRHGNKGVISRVLPEEDMPFLPDGTPLEIVLNPLGVPSRMNIGQVLEVHLGYAAKALGWHIATPVFDGADENDIMDTLELAGKDRSGKTILYDGRTGEQFDNPVTVGYMYILKLIHLVDDKIHARSTGPYSLVTQQPLGGKAQFGGQRFGEMEVWALYAYGAAHTLQEILTVKSDDIVGRVKAYEAIVKGEDIPEPGVPESFKVLIKELQSLCLDVKVLTEEKKEIQLKELGDDDSDVIEVSSTGNIEDIEEQDRFGALFDDDELELGELDELDDIDDLDDDDDDLLVELDDEEI